MRFLQLASLGLLTAVIAGCSTLQDSEPVGDQVDFVRHIKPILQERCVQCHNKTSMPQRISFESRELAMQEGARGRAIIPGDPDNSRIVNFINAPRDTVVAMPRTGHDVTAAEAETIREWIAAGAKWPDGPAGQLRP